MARRYLHGGRVRSSWAMWGCGMVSNEGSGPPLRMANTILVVDDERNIVQLARLYLGNEGFRVEEANDGKAAIEKARTCNPDLVILDIMMPEMDGLTVCKEIRKTSNVPVIILTARGDDIDKIVAWKSARTTTSQSRSTRVSSLRASKRCYVAARGPCSLRA